MISTVIFQRIVAFPNGVNLPVVLQFVLQQSPSAEQAREKGKPLHFTGRGKSHEQKPRDVLVKD